MKKYYGVGTWWKNRPHQHFHDFINDGKACIHASLDKPTQREISNRRRFRDIFNTIEIKDVIYLKSFIIRGSKLRIRAVGEVKSKKDKVNDSIFCVEVKYNKNHDYNGIIEDLNIDDDIQRNERNERIYQETNPKVIKSIDELLLK
jgi:antitoxin component YwqK of YwqJK toxin-antitoxin module